MRNYLKNNLIILILLNSGNLFGYLFQLVIARGLSPVEYGIFNSLNSTAILLAAPAVVLPMVFSRFTIQLISGSGGAGVIRSLIVDGSRLVSLILVFLLIVGISARSLIAAYLHIEASTPIVLMLCTAGLSLLLPVYLGVLQGLHRFIAFGIGSSSVMLIRFMAGFLLVLVFSLGVDGALAATLVGIMISLGICGWAVKDILFIPRIPLPDGIFVQMAKYSFPVFLSTTMCMLLGNIDLILVRHYQPEEAGLYATAAILGRIALVLPGVLVFVLFPETAQARNSGNVDGHLIQITLGLTIVLGGGYALVCNIFPVHIINLLFGGEYVQASSLLEIISVAMALLAVANVFFTYGLARSNYGFLWPLTIGALLMVFLISVNHSSPKEIATILLLSIMAILVGTLVWYQMLTKLAPTVRI